MWHGVHLRVELDRVPVVNSWEVSMAAAKNKDVLPTTISTQPSRGSRPIWGRVLREATTVATILDGRSLLDCVGRSTLEQIVRGCLRLLGTSSAVIDKHGNYALAVFHSPWCRYLPQASRSLCATAEERIFVEAVSTTTSIGRHEPGATIRRCNERRKIRVLLADDHRVLRRTLMSLLAEEQDLEIVGEASDGVEAVELAGQCQPDVILMDITMPRLNGIEATRQITAAWPQVQVIGLSMHEEEAVATQMRQAGATAYLTKGGSPDQLLAMIRREPANQGPLFP